MNFMARALSESDGSPSSTRVNLLLLLLFTMGLIGFSFAASPGGKLPEVPSSLSDLIKFLFGAGTAKAALSSGADLIAVIKGPANAGKPENATE